MSLTTLAGFQNRITINASNDGFKTFLSGGTGNGLKTHTLPSGSYYADGLRNQILATIVAGNPDFSGSMTIGYSSTGHWTFAHGTNFAIEFTDTTLRNFLGFTSNLSANSSYTGARRSQGSFYPSVYVTSFMSQSKYTGGAIQTKALSGVVMTTLKGVRVQEGAVTINFINGEKELVSPAGSFGTSYVGTGITETFHAEYFWWNIGSQGWADGRPVRYFANSANCALTLDANAQNYSSGTFSTWNFETNGDWSEHYTQMYPPANVYWSFKARVFEYVAASI